MSLTWQDPRWVALARAAAAELGASNDATVSAILAQWQCEQPRPAPWPPVHNNPGNLTGLIGGLDATPHSLATSAPGVGYLYQYATPGAGAVAYARYLLHSSRYPSAVAAARAGNGTAFLQSVTSGGYGTRLSCCLSLLAQVHLAPAPDAVPLWQCTASVVNVRSGAGTGFAVIGHATAGAKVHGWPVPGGPYPAAGIVRTTWLNIGSGRYAAAWFFRRIA